MDNDFTWPEHYREAVCDYNNGEGFWTVDAWRVEDVDEENGEVVAVIHDKSGDVYYTQSDALYSKVVGEVVKEMVDEIKSGKTE